MKLGAVSYRRFRAPWRVATWLWVKKGATCLQLRQPLCPGMRSCRAPKDLPMGVRGVRKDRGQVLQCPHFPLALTAKDRSPGRAAPWQGPGSGLDHHLLLGPWARSSPHWLQFPHPTSTSWGRPGEGLCASPTHLHITFRTESRTAPTEEHRAHSPLWDSEPLPPASASGWGPHTQPGTWWVLPEPPAPAVRDMPCGEAVWMFEASQHSRL